MDDGLRLDLLDGAAELAIGEGVDGDRGLEAGAHLADVGLVHEGAGADLGEVGHLDDGRATAGRARPRLDDLPERDGLLDDRAHDRRGHARIVEALLREVERGARADDRRRGVRKVELRRLVLLRGDDLGGEEVVGALLLDLGDLELLLRGVEVGLRLVVLVLHVTRVELHDEIPGAHERAGLDGHLDHLAGGARLDLDDVDRFDHAGGLGRHDDRATLDGRGLDGERLLLLAGAGEREAGEDEEREGVADHGGNSGGVRVVRTAGRTPAVDRGHRSRPMSASICALAVRASRRAWMSACRAVMSVDCDVMRSSSVPAPRL